MLSPNDLGPKGAAPSIWSFDSGYSSTSAVEEEGGLLHPILPYGESSTNNDFLPGIPPENGSCLECEFWKTANPEDNIKCHGCRLPEIVEPLSVLPCGTSRGKAILPRLDTCIQIQAAQAATLKTPSRRLSNPYPPPGLGAISRCSTCELSALIDPSSSKVCQSCSYNPSCLSPDSEKSPRYEVKRSRAGRNSKLPLSALTRLQAWLDANHHDPYPNAETKRLLAQECGITEKQVTTWFTNARARQLGPLDTYLSSSSEDEDARESDIEVAAAAGGLTYIREPKEEQDGRRAASISDASIFSNPQSHARPSRRGKKKNYRRNANPETPQTPLLLSPSSITSPLDGLSQTDPDMWQCTFCRKSLVPKSWRRHEETQHRPKAQWTCMLYGPRLSFPTRSNSASTCAFCMAKNPSEEHFLSHHRIEDCAKRDLGDRTFFRPDHLRQHIKNFHNASLFDIVQARWKKAAEAVVEGWTCGFCGERLETWDKRETHIANHFKDGLTMAAWNDCPENATKVDGKSKGKEKDPPPRLPCLGGHPFPGRSTRSSGSQPTNQDPQPETQHPPFSNAWDQIPSSFGRGITQPQAPVLPELPLLDPLTIDCGNFVDWSLPASTDRGMQYTLADTNMFDPSTTSLAQQFDSTFAMNLYGNPLDYHHGSWGQLHPQTEPQPQQQQQYLYQHQDQHQNQHHQQ